MILECLKVLIKSDFELALRNIYENLNDNGFYIFDILNLDAITDDVVKSDSERMTDRRTTNDGTTIYNVRQSTIDRKNGHLTSENNFTIQTQEEEKKVKNNHYDESISFRTNSKYPVTHFSKRISKRQVYKNLSQNQGCCRCVPSGRTFACNGVLENKKGDFRVNLMILRFFRYACIA